MSNKQTLKKVLGKGLLYLSAFLIMFLVFHFLGLGKSLNPSQDIVYIETGTVIWIIAFMLYVELIESRLQLRFRNRGWLLWTLRVVVIAIMLILSNYLSLLLPKYLVQAKQSIYIIVTIMIVVVTFIYFKANRQK